MYMLLMLINLHQALSKVAGLTPRLAHLVQAEGVEVTRTGAGAGMGRPAPGKAAAARRAAAVAGASVVADLVRSSSHWQAYGNCPCVREQSYLSGSLIIVDLSPRFSSRVLRSGRASR